MSVEARTPPIKRYRSVTWRPGESILVHRRRAEAAIGHKLPPKAVVHHVDEDPWNPDARLVICPDQRYHALLHIRMRVRAAGGNPNTDKICSACRCVLPLTAFGSKRPNPDGLNDACRACTNQRMQESKRRCRARRLAQQP